MKRNLLLVLCFCLIISCIGCKKQAVVNASDESDIIYVTSEIYIEDDSQAESKTSSVKTETSEKPVSKPQKPDNKNNTSKENTASENSVKEIASETPSSNQENSFSSVTEADKHTHILNKKTVAPTCGEKGYTSYECECGFESHKENYVPATKIHTFNKKHKCTVCGFVCTISGNISGNYNGNEPVKYYISKSYGELVIFGNGAMPKYYVGHAPWHASDYFDSIKTIIITDNVTNISINAFSVDMPNVKTLVIGDSVKKIESSSITGLHLDELKIGTNVETISRNAMANYKIGKIYLPKATIKYEDFPLNNKVFYQGSKEELYNITVWDTQTSSHMTLKERIDKYSLMINVEFNAW